MGWSCFPFLYKRNKNNLQSIKLYKNNQLFVFARTVCKKKWRNDNNIKLFTFWWSVSSARECCYYLSFSPPPPFEISSLRPWPSPHPRHWGKFSGHHLPRDGSSKRERDITSRESFQGNATLSSTLIFNFNYYKMSEITSQFGNSDSAVFPQNRLILLSKGAEEKTLLSASQTSELAQWIFGWRGKRGKWRKRG